MVRPNGQREAWSEQRGLKLLTAHRAKGLEFDDVVILDGGWERPSRNEDQDAPRRLFYVAMTRARRNLIVMSNDHHEYLPAGSPSVVTREVRPDLSSLPGRRRIFQSADPSLVDLSFAGRLGAGHAALTAISAAKVGDPVQLNRAGDRWELHDRHGRPLSRMSRKFAPPPGTRFARGEIFAILEWRKDDSEESFHHTLRREAWEVVLPELVFEVE